MKIIFFSIVLPLCISACTAREKSLPSGNLELSIQKGKSPLAIRITGPKSFIDHYLSSCERREQSIDPGGAHIHWGKANATLNSNDPCRYTIQTSDCCTRELENTFYAPGKYSITASIDRSNPNDSVSTMWQASAQIEVTSDNPGPAIFLFRELKKGDKLKIGHLTAMRYAVLVKEPSEISIKLMDQNGKELLTYSKSHSKSEESFFMFELKDIISLSKTIKNPTQVYLAAQLRAKGQTLAKDTSETFEILPGEI